MMDRGPIPKPPWRRRVTKPSGVRNVTFVPEKDSLTRVDVRGIITDVVGILTSVTT